MDFRRPRLRGASRRRRPRETARVARCARWLGFDRNPLRRASDRIEAGIRLTLLLLFLTAIPLAIATGRWADHAALNRIHAQAAADHQVRAVLLQDASAYAYPDPSGGQETVWVPARWTAPDGVPRTGQVLAPLTASRGSTVQAWTGATGAITTPPGNHATVVTAVVITAAGTVTGVVSLLAVTGLLARLVLDRRRLARWDAEWGSAGPLWTGRRR